MDRATAFYGSNHGWAKWPGSFLMTGAVTMPNNPGARPFEVVRIGIGSFDRGAMYWVNLTPYAACRFGDALNQLAQAGPAWEGNPMFASYGGSQAPSKHIVVSWLGGDYAPDHEPTVRIGIEDRRRSGRGAWESIDLPIAEVRRLADQVAALVAQIDPPARRELSA